MDLTYQVLVLSAHVCFLKLTKPYREYYILDMFFFSFKFNYASDKVDHVSLCYVRGVFTVL